MKKLGVYLLLFTLIFTAYITPISAEGLGEEAEANGQSGAVVQQEQPDFDVKLSTSSREMIEAIGCSLPKKTDDELVLRGDFIRIMAGLLMLYQEDETKSEEENLNNAVSQCVALGIIADADQVDAQREITFLEALKIGVEAVGYGFKAELEGGWPYGYFAIGNQLKLNKGLQIDMDDTITYGELYIFLRNLVESDIIYQLSFGNDAEFYTGKNRSILTEIYKLYEIEGIVDGNEYTSLYDPEITCREGQISINGTCFAYDGDNILGQKVRGYASGYKDEYRIVWLEMDHTEIRTITSDDILYAENHSIGYQDENDRLKRAALENSLAVVYNGKADNTYSMEDFLIDYGYIELFDNNNNGKYDVALVHECSILYETNIETYENYIQGENNGFLSLADNDLTYSIYMNGEKIELNDIPLNAIINCYQSRDNTLIRLVVSTETVDGQVTGYEADEGKKIYIDDTPYQFNEYFNTYYLNALAVGDKVSLLQDEYGNISAVMDKRGGMLYGYLIKAVYEKMEGIYQLKLFSDMGNWEKLMTAEKVLVDGIRMNASDLIPIIGTERETKEQLIRYMVDKNGRISVIDTANNAEPGIAAESEEQFDNLRPYQFAASSDTKASIPFRSNMFLPFFSLSSEAVTFKIKTDQSLTDEERCSIVGASFLQSINHKGIDLKPYNVNEAGVAEVLVYMDSNDKILESNALNGLVKEIRHTIDEDGESIIRMEIFNPELKFETYIIRDRNVLNELNSLYLTEEEVLAGKLPISPGDYVRFALNSDNEIDVISKDFDYHSRTIHKISTSPAQTPTYYFGKVFAREDNIFMIVPITSDGGFFDMEDVEARVCLNVENSVAIFEAARSGYSITEGSRNAVVTYQQDNLNCSTILARVVNGVTKNIVIYR